MIVFISILFSIVLGDLAWWRWADQRLKQFKHSRSWRAALAIFMGGQLLYFGWMLTFPSSARRSHTWLPKPFVAAVYIWSLITLPATLVGLGVSSASKAIAKYRRPELASDPKALSRRLALQRIGLAAPPVFTALATARSMPQISEFSVRPVHLRVPGLPRELDGLRIAQVADIHVGKFTNGRVLNKIVDATNALRADLVLLVGDLIDLSIDDLDTGIAMVKRMDPRCGMAIIEGNHDLIEDPDAFDSRARGAGLPLLQDEAMTVPVRGTPVQLLGTRWGAATGDRRRATDADFSASIERVMQLRDPSVFPILLAHHPHTFDPAAAAGLPLTLSGHTHGGLLNLTPGPRGFGFGRAMYRYWSGVYTMGQSQLVVSNGVGNWFPLRVNAPAEIIDLTLHCS